MYTHIHVHIYRQNMTDVQLYEPNIIYVHMFASDKGFYIIKGDKSKDIEHTPN